MSPFHVLATGFIGMIVFLYGFLPMKIIGRKGEEEKPIPDFISGIRVNPGILYKPAVNRLVLLVIDALRDDFVTGPEASVHMPYLSSVILNGEGMLFTSLVEPPTVTLPRIKAMTMGTIPNYADIVLNVLEKDASGAKEDSIVGRAYSSNLKIIFYGDDTWLRLFPNLFLRAEGTTSFYVSDFTEVDNNVTRHIGKELRKDDWNIMILHYLGLDHIGHIHGPYSHLVPQKLMEMDNIIQRLHQGLMKWGSSTLLVVSGDHGMKDTGGHGGATHPETHVPLAFLSPMLSQSNGCPRKSSSEDMVINQRDLAPTLSALLGLPPPSGNLGRSLTIVLRCFLPDPAALLYALHVNAWQVAGLLGNSGASKTDGHYLYEESSKLHSEWIISEGKRINKSSYKDFESSPQQSDRIIQLYSISVSEMTSKFAESVIKFDYYAMFLGSLITLQAFSTLFMNAERPLKSSYAKAVLILAITIFMLHIIFCSTNFCSDSSFCELDLLTFLSVSILTLIMAINVSRLIYGIQFFTLCSIKGKWEEIFNCPLHCLFMAGGFLHALSFASSSFIEEEHQTWQFLCVSLIVLQGALACRNLHIKSRKSIGRTISLSNSTLSKKKVKGAIDKERSNKRSSVSTKVDFSNKLLHFKCHVQSMGDHIDNEDEEMYKLIEDSVSKSDCGAKQERHLQLSSSLTEYFRDNVKMNWFKFSWTFALLLFTHRILRDWNHTGDKWGNIPDMADWISKPENIIVRSVMVVFSLVGLVFVLHSSSLLNSSLVNLSLSALSILCIFAYRAAIGDVSMFYPYPSSRGIIEFKIFLFLLTLILANGCYKAYKILMNCDTMKSHYNPECKDDTRKVTAVAVITQHICIVWILFCTFLKRPSDISIVVIYIFSCRMITDTLAMKVVTSHNTGGITLLSQAYVWLGMVFYFHQGNSNSLASIDLQAGYVGQDNYNAIIVGTLLFCHTFSMPITSLVLLFHSLVSATLRSPYFSVRFLKKALSTAGESVAFARLFPVVIYLPLITIQRHHLFVWTVFSPKLIYEVTLTMAALLGLALLPILDLCIS